ncbi:type I-E CRISPR-associated endoribonuclease Cas2e, partial [Escherichia coli]|uniref:type I-E CRISPR-associated endoribonuclease Cas2e n=1 Tax=Escherichia coli TaxID=562 RepID=UPI002FBD6BEE
KRIREMIWQQFTQLGGCGYVVMGWATNTESGFVFKTRGEKTRITGGFVGGRLVCFIAV